MLDPNDSDPSTVPMPDEPFDEANNDLPIRIRQMQRKFDVAIAAIAIARKALDGVGLISTYKLDDIERSLVEHAYGKTREVFLVMHRTACVSPEIDDASLRAAILRAEASIGPAEAWRRINAAFGATIAEDLTDMVVDRVVREFGLARTPIVFRGGYAVLTVSMYGDDLSRRFYNRFEYSHTSVESFFKAIHCLLELLRRVAPEGLARHFATTIQISRMDRPQPENIPALAPTPLKFKGYQKKIEVLIPMDLATAMANLLSMHA